MRRPFRWIVMATALITMGVTCSSAMAIGYLSGVLEKPAYVRALTSLLYNAPSWTRAILKRNGAYVSGVRTTKDIAGTTHELFHLCVPMPNCDDTTIIVMFAQNGAQAWAGLREKGSVSYLGAPGDAQQAVLKQELYVPEPARATGPYLYQVIKRDPAHAAALNRLLDHADKLPDWAQGMGRGKGWSVDTPVTYVTIDGTAYELFATCESQNCNLSQLTVMFAPDATQAWGALNQEGTISYLGAPSAAQQKALRETFGDGSRKNATKP